MRLRDGPAGSHSSNRNRVTNPLQPFDSAPMRRDPGTIARHRARFLLPYRCGITSPNGALGKSVLTHNTG
jgi:hypothetical protein